MFDEGILGGPNVEDGVHHNLGVPTVAGKLDESDGESSESSGESASSAADSDCVANLICEGGAAPGKASSSRAAASSGQGRQARGHPWGPFAIAEVVSRGKSIGHGITCGLHTNVGDAPTCRCDKRLDYGKGKLSAEDCILQLKRWAVMGLRISKTDPEGRSTHRDINARTECVAGLSSEELDVERDRIYALWLKRLVCDCE